MRHGSTSIRLVVLCLAVVATAAAQQDPKPQNLPDTPAAKSQDEAPKRQNPFNATAGVLTKKSIFFPNIATSVGPLRTKQKFELFADESAAPSRFLSSGVGAGIGQAHDSLAGYGQGAGGYGKRFGSSMASAASTNFFGTFVIASISHRDPRYFVTLHPGKGYRFGYALSRIVISRTDDGRSGANWPGIVGPLLAESLATSYLPVKEQTAGRTFQRYGIRIGLNTASNALRQYWPTIFQKLGVAKIAPGLKPDASSTPPSP